MQKTNPQYNDIVDSCTLFKTLNKETYMIEGNRGNIKITTIEDLYVLRALIRYKEDLEAFTNTGAICK
jgi:2-C-methyl-D-erythritol 4-phosphate cytidylyltransferase